MAHKEFALMFFSESGSALRKIIPRDVMQKEHTFTHIHTQD